MAENSKARMIRCPECFAKDIDVFMFYDEADEEFYCYKCCYTGTKEEVERDFSHFIDRKYRMRGKPHPAEVF